MSKWISVISLLLLFIFVFHEGDIYVRCFRSGKEIGAIYIFLMMNYMSVMILLMWNYHLLQYTMMQNFNEKFVNSKNCSPFHCRSSMRYAPRRRDRLSHSRKLSRVLERNL